MTVAVATTIPLYKLLAPRSNCPAVVLGRRCVTEKGQPVSGPMATEKAPDCDGRWKESARGGGRRQHATGDRTPAERVQLCDGGVPIGRGIAGGRSGGRRRLRGVGPQTAGDVPPRASGRVACARLGKFTLCGDGLCVGFDSADAVSEEYSGSNPFKGGKILFVGVTVEKKQYLDLEVEAAGAFARD